MKKILALLLFFGFSFTAAFSQTRIKLEMYDGLYHIPCKVNGFDLKFVFDTGAYSVTLSSSIAKYMRKNGYLSDTDYMGIGTYTTADGSTGFAERIKIRTLEIGSHKLYDIEAIIIPGEDASLLLGQSALIKLGKFQFDYSNNVFLIFDGSNNNVSYGCVTGNCYNGYGTFTWTSGESYAGNFYNGKKHGKGTFTWSNGEIYDGYFLDDKCTGYGSFTSPNGEMYVGDFLDGKYHGYGTITYSNGDRYEGNFRNGQRNGYGTYIWRNGQRKNCYFKNGDIINNQTSSEEDLTSSSHFAFEILFTPDYLYVQNNFVDILNLRGSAGLFLRFSSTKVGVVYGIHKFYLIPTKELTAEFNQDLSVALEFNDWFRIGGGKSLPNSTFYDYNLAYVNFNTTGRTFSLGFNVSYYADKNFNLEYYSLGLILGVNLNF